MELSMNALLQNLEKQVFSKIFKEILKQFTCDKLKMISVRI